jgi:hypothetical protein
MSDPTYDLIGSVYKSTADIPRDDDICYRCNDCGDVIPSVPAHNIGCKCGNVFIDRDYWRLVVADMSKLSVLRRAS